MKKILLTLALVLSVGMANAQKSKVNPCSGLFEIKKDAFTKVEQRFLRKPIQLQTEGEKVVFDIITAGETVLASLMFAKAHCIEKASDIEFLFQDDVTLTFQNNDKFNCDGYLSVRFSGENECGKFSIDKLKAIRLRTTKKTFVISLSKVQANQIFKAFSCLAKK